MGNCAFSIVPAPTTTQRLFKVMKVLSTCQRHYKIPKLKVSKQRQRTIKEGFLSVTIVKIALYLKPATHKLGVKTTKIGKLSRVGLAAKISTCKHTDNKPFSWQNKLNLNESTDGYLTVYTRVEKFFRGEFLVDAGSLVSLISNEYFAFKKLLGDKKPGLRSV